MRTEGTGADLPAINGADSTTLGSRLGTGIDRVLSHDRESE